MRSREAVQGDTARLRAVARRAKAGESIKIVALGGSVTNGGGCGSSALHASSQGSFGKCSWTNRFTKWMSEEYQNQDIKLVNRAQPATTSAWALSHFDRVTSVEPDLILVDYAVNDPIYFSDNDAHHNHERMMQAVTERLIRRFFEYAETRPEGKVPALVYVVTQRGWENSTYAYPNDVYVPVCREYGIPVVSVKDSIWPEMTPEPRTELWPTVKGAHPTWLGHQLITDVMAFAWVGATTNVDLRFSVDEKEKTRTPALMKDTPFHFSGVAAEKVGICQQGYLSPPFGSPSYLKPSFVGIGWTLANDNGKVGWVYDLATAGKYSPIETARRVLTNLRRSKTHVADHSHQKEAALDARRARSPLTQNAISNTEEGVDDINVILRRMVVKRKRSSVPSHLNKIPLLIKNMTLPGILSFPLRFNSSSPGLILEHLKSYEGYGDAVIWVTRSDDAVEIEGATRRSPTLKETAEAALAVAWENSKFATKCRHEHSQEKRGSPRRVHRSADCSLINSGSWDDPAIVEGVVDRKYFSFIFATGLSAQSFCFQVNGKIDRLKSCPRFVTVVFCLTKMRGFLETHGVRY